ncbi:hypothetical protein EYC80_007166 [Monilinia laxa]|uniref:Uncharacterized protein n=1 Tax=Monilinia laxa TaxID=61186 RepID=A0A5N6K0F3_MONLA|nr:hypothetical protein EYC80_007166 [Monilinia laxa]
MYTDATTGIHQPSNQAINQLNHPFLHSLLDHLIIIHPQNIVSVEPIPIHTHTISQSLHQNNQYPPLTLDIGKKDPFPNSFPVVYGHTHTHLSSCLFSQ